MNYLNNDLITLLKTLKNSKNPNEFLMEQLNNQSANNSLASLAMANPNNLESIVRDAYKKQGINIDDVMELINKII